MRVRLVLPGLALVSAAVVALGVVVLAMHFGTDANMALFLADPGEKSDLPAYAGFLTSAAIIIWWTAAILIRQDGGAHDGQAVRRWVAILPESLRAPEGLAARGLVRHQVTASWRPVAGIRDAGAHGGATTMATHTFQPDHYFTTLGAYPPVLHFAPSDTVVTTTTVDAASHDARLQQVAGLPAHPPRRQHRYTIQ